eukprot:405272-Lingulodinium_polyedra.AAC.1
MRHPGPPTLPAPWPTDGCTATGSPSMVATQPSGWQQRTVGSAPVWARAWCSGGQEAPRLAHGSSHVGP